VSGWLGTAMEFMDFQLYSLAAAIVLNRLFFPEVSPAVGLIAAMGTYGVGYVARLVGAIYFGRMGDRIGPKRVLVITREITWVGSYRFVDEITDAIAAMDAGLDVSPVITHTFDLPDVEKALAVAADRSTGSSKVLLRVGAAEA
jgi:threonine dehydrogenase-like Zn-dependent dehydrogenase